MQWQWIDSLTSQIKRHRYGSAVIVTLMVTTLFTITGGITGWQQRFEAMQTRIEARRLHHQAEVNIWCTTRITMAQETLLVGHYPGYRMADVLRLHGAAPRFGNSPTETDCYRHWQQAATAVGELAERYQGSLKQRWTPPEDDAGEDAIRRAILSAMLDVEPVAEAEETSDELSPSSWCLSQLQTLEFVRIDLPHLPGGREAIEASLVQLDSALETIRFRVRETVCFKSHNAAKSWMRRTKFVPPAGASQADYLEAVSAWLNIE